MSDKPTKIKAANGSRAGKHRPENVLMGAFVTPRKKAITMGVGTIMRAKKIVMVVNGENKADAVKGMLTGDCTPKNQASILRFHKDVTVILDKEAASKIL